MTVGYEVRDGIAYLSFDRVEKHNALRDSDIAALITAVRRLDRDDSAQVGVLFGNGRSFSSGGDVQDRLQRSMDEESYGERTHEGEAFTRCDNWKPIIAAVHGYCLGHALGTALLCDHLVAARDAKFQVTETKIGFPAPSFMARLGKPAFATEVSMTGRMFGAEEAWEAGFVTRLVDEGQHVAAAEELARQIMENPQPAVRELVRVRRCLLAESNARFASMSGSFRWTGSSEARDAIASRGGSA
jgi:enoyl-CoA hydratase/carnithine racemase